jgi:hypothetical protein
MKKMVRNLLIGAAACLLFVAGSGVAWAKNYDQVKPFVVIPDGQPDAIKKNNGVTPGTVQLFYTVNALTFASGDFAVFRLDLSIQPGTPGDTKYPDALTLFQTGSQNLVLTPATTSFSVTGSDWTGSTLVTISIPSNVPADPALNDDGADLVGNLQMTADPPTNHLSTPSTVQVHIKLVHPTACLKVYNFITAQDDSTILTSASLNVRKKDNLVMSTSPGQFSDDVLVANTCTVPQSFDLSVSLDPNFQTNPNNNPGNAVFTYLTTGEVDSSTFSLSSFGTGTKQGQQLCLGNVTIPANETFLATIHSKMQDGISPPASATFSASLYGAGSGCSGALDPLAEPNPASTSLLFTPN